MTFTEAGALGRCGFNAVGIAITANYLESDRDYRQVGVPLALIRRKVLESEHVALAMRTVYCTGEIRGQQHDRQPSRRRGDRFRMRAG